MHSYETYILQWVGSHTLWEWQAIYTSDHHQDVGPRTLEQWASLKTRPGKILCKGQSKISQQL